MDTARRAAFALSGFLLLSGCLPKRWLVRTTDPLSVEEHAVLAASYEAQGLPKEAASHYEAILREDKKHLPSLLALGDLSFKDGKPAKARRYYARVLDADPENARAHNNMAMAYLSEEKLAKAEMHGKMALHDPAIAPYAWDTLANVAIQGGRWAEAQAAIVEAQKTAPSDDRAFALNLKLTQEKLNSLSSP